MLTGDKLRLLRLIKGMKQQVVAQQMGISQQAYSKLEKRRSLQGNCCKRYYNACNAPPRILKQSKN